MKSKIDPIAAAAQTLWCALAEQERLLREARTSCDKVILKRECKLEIGQTRLEVVNSMREAISNYKDAAMRNCTGMLILIDWLLEHDESALDKFIAEMANRSN